MRAGTGRTAAALLRLTVRVLVVLAVVVAVAAPGSNGSARADTGTADEVHYSFGSTADSVVFDWRGTATTLDYGLDASYGSQAVAHQPAIVPVDDPGPFQQVTLTGLAPGTTYYYAIEGTAVASTFTTAATGDFTWVDVGDTGATTCKPWVAQTHALIAAQQPAFVTHGGDISYANECGVPAVDQYYLDQEVWSHSAAFMPVWGNHEYGLPREGAPSGTPRDSMANYKGRSAIPNAQTVPNDTATQINNPGCGWETNSTTNTCQGDDWGWFQAGHVLFVSYPEPWPNAYPAWEKVVQGLMSQAQGDPTVDFIVTYGHRPAYSNQLKAANTALRTALDQLAALYSPTPANPDGKYVLNVAHHVHGEEAFAPINGLVHITDGGGGAGQASYNATPAASSVFRLPHPGILSARYDAAAKALSVSLLCGPDYGINPKTHCDYGTTLWSTTFTRPDSTPASPRLTAGIDDGVTGPSLGQSVTYTATAANPVPDSVARGVAMTVTLPPQYTIAGSDGGTAGSGNTVTWPPSDVPGGSTLTHQVSATLTTGSSGDQLAAMVQLASTDGACGDQLSSCVATDTDTVSAVTQWITNQSVENGLTGWTGLYSSRSQVGRVSTDAYDGVASVQVTNKSSARGAAGVNAKPRPVTATTSGTAYTASAWVRGQAKGQVLYVQLKEFGSNGTVVGSRSVRYQVPDTAWHQLTVTYPAAAGGDQLLMSIYCGNLAPKAWFLADWMSLTSPD